VIRYLDLETVVTIHLLDSCGQCPAVERELSVHPRELAIELVGKDLPCLHVERAG
jgi:hypothetical protein